MYPPAPHESTLKTGEGVCVSREHDSDVPGEA